MTKSDYVKHSAERTQACKPVPSSLGEKGLKFQGQTAYAQSFKGTRGEVATSKKPSNNFTSAGKFEGESVNRSEFKAWNSAPRALMKPESGMDAAAEDRNFQTEASGAFNDKGYQVRRSRAPERQATTQVPFEGRSEATDAFTVC